MRWPTMPTCVAMLVAAVSAVPAQTADTAMINGKIVTVDDRFSIGQALAIRGQRILAVGSTADIEKLHGPATRVIDLAGRTVIPGLIDNHSHWVRAAEHDELRFDGSPRAHRRSRCSPSASRRPSPASGSRCSAAGRKSSSPTTQGLFARRAGRIAPNIRWC